jgi:hypothetical protein
MAGHLTDEDLLALDPNNTNSTIEIEHLDGCPECQERLEHMNAFRMLGKRLREADRADAPGLFNTMMKR